MNLDPPNSAYPSLPRRRQLADNTVPSVVDEKFECMLGAERHLPPTLSHRLKTAAAGAVSP